MNSFHKLQDIQTCTSTKIQVYENSNPVPIHLVLTHRFQQEPDMALAVKPHA